MKLNIIPILALTFQEGYALLEAAQTKAHIWDLIFRILVVYAFTYIIFFCCTGIVGWYKNIRSAPLVIIGGYVVMLVIIIVAANRSLYWYSWKPNFLASS